MRYKGVEFRVYGEKEPIISHSFIQTNVSDLPASRKCSGLHGHNSKYFMCPICDMPFFRLVDPDCFDPTSMCCNQLQFVDINIILFCSEFTYRSDWKYLKYAFRARDVDHETAEEIRTKKGIGWSTMNLLPGWMPGATNVTDMMHALYLCSSSSLPFTLARASRL
jgi:hypothetical protein